MQSTTVSEWSHPFTFRVPEDLQEFSDKQGTGMGHSPFVTGFRIPRDFG
jgi:hypothetical protein